MNVLPPLTANSKLFIRDSREEVDNLTIIYSDTLKERVRLDVYSSCRADASELGRIAVPANSKEIEGPLVAVNERFCLVDTQEIEELEQEFVDKIFKDSGSSIWLDAVIAPTVIWNVASRYVPAGSPEPTTLSSKFPAITLCIRDIGLKVV